MTPIDYTHLRMWDFPIFPMFVLKKRFLKTLDSFGPDKIHQIFGKDFNTGRLITLKFYLF